MKDKIVELTNAVYNLLEYFPESDPLKNRAKEKALAVMENLSLVFADGGWVSLKDYFSSNREKTKLQTLEDIEIILNCLKLARMRGWINGVSFLIVFNEYEKIKKEIGIPIIISERTQKPVEPVLNEDAMEKQVRDTQFFIAPKLQDDKIFKLSDRQIKIIDFLERNQKAQVMDLMTVLPDITKRTVRRDLDELLKMGKVAREGEFNQVLYRIA